MKRARSARSMMKREEFYRGLDPGIRFAVRVLHSAGIETCQSCQGGEGHAYDNPTIDLIAGADEARGFAAIAALSEYGIPVIELAIVWPMCHGHPYEKLWRIVLKHAIPDRADERPIFIMELCA